MSEVLMHQQTACESEAAQPAREPHLPARRARVNGRERE